MIVALFYLVALFADYDRLCTEPFDTQATRSYIPPQPIHWFDADGHFRPHVYALKGKRDPRTFKLSYAPDRQRTARSGAVRRTAIRTTCSA